MKLQEITTKSLDIKTVEIIIRDVFLKYKHFILYSIIGFTAVSLDFFIFYIFVNIVGFDKFVSNTIGTSIAIVYSFSLNTLFNFKTKDVVIKRFISFAIVGLIGMGVTTIILYIFVNSLGLDKNLVKLGSLVVVVIIQYTLNKHISFKEKFIV